MSMTVRFTENIEETMAASFICARQLHGDSERSLFIQSLPLYLDAQPPFRFFIAGPSSGASPESWAAAGLVTFVTAPMLEEKFLLLECVWTDGSRAVTDLVWRLLLTFVLQLDFAGICVPKDAPGGESLLRQGLTDQGVFGLPVASIRQFPVQLAQDGVWTSLTPGPSSTRLVTADCYVIATLPGPGEPGGVIVAPTIVTAYRGEGRLLHGQFSACASLNDLIRQVSLEGFRPRVSGTFTGQLREQFLHQGYVDQPVISLTTSRSVARIYATAGRLREAGVVFTVDLGGVAASTPVFDGLQTLFSHAQLISPSVYDILETALDTLGLQSAGRFLESIYDATRMRIESGQEEFEAVTGRADRLGAIPIEMRNVLLPRLGSSTLEDLVRSFDEYWMFALGKIGAVDTLDASSGDARTRSMMRDPFLYEATFRQVEHELSKALITRGSQEDKRRGWDLTAFGYIAKTILDHELFVSGRIDSKYILSATIVDNRGNPLSVVDMSQA